MRRWSAVCLGCLVGCGSVEPRDRDAAASSLDAPGLDAPGLDATGLDAEGADALALDADPPGADAGSVGPLSLVARDVAITPRGSARVPDVAYDADHDAYVVVYTWVPGPEFRTEARVVTLDASGLPSASAPLTIDQLAGVPHNSAEAAVATGPGVPALVVWSDDRLGSGDGQLEIYGQFVRIAGAPSPSAALEGSPFRISEVDVTGEALPAVAWTGAGYYVAWADDRERGVRHEDARVVYGRTVSPSGALGPSTRLGDDALFQTFPQLSRCGDRLLAAWTDYLAPGGPLVIRYRGRMLDASTGAPSSEIVTLVPSSMTVPEPPGLACDEASGTWRIAWPNAGTPSSKQVSLASVDREGGVSAPTVVTMQSDGGGAPRLAAVPASGALVLSFHAQDSTFGYARELSADGARLGEVMTLTESPPGLGTFWTSVAAHPARPEALVVTTLDYDRVAVTVLRGE